MRQYAVVGLALGLISAIACSSSENHGSSGGGGDGTGGILLLSAGGGTGHGSSGKNGGSGATNGNGSGATNGSGANGPDAGNGTGQGGTNGTSNGGPTPGHGLPVTTVTPVNGGSACASQALGAAAGSLDIFIMLDKSQSMSDKTANGSSKWDVITQSLNDFVNDPKSAGIEAGLGFFGIATGGSGDRNNNTSCTAAEYANPVVPIAALPPNAKPIASAIGQQGPGGNTPTEPALHGAINYAAQWAQQHPTHKVIVVFATDGLPNGCNSTVAGAAAIAAAGVKGPPPIPTYVIGVFGDQDCPGGVTQGQQCDVVNNTNQIAKGGGTQSAFIVNASGDTGAQFLQALNSIRTANAVGCDFAVPAPSGGRVVDFSQATVEYTPGGGSATSIEWVESSGGCDPSSGGWYYDSTTAPNHMLLCDATCTEVKADPMARVDVRLACLPPGTHGSGGATGAGGSGMCLLDGQSCTDSGECCSNMCSGGICHSIR